MLYDETTTTDDALKAWDAGESIWSVSMGGLGPSYEQCIQLLTIELLREWNGKPLPSDEDNHKAWKNWGDDVAHRVDKEVGGFSGAQVGAAKNLAANILRRGYGPALLSMKELDGERLIQISKNWPSLATVHPVRPPK